ncbi:MAG TPA: hypothetical protein VF545_00260, partial [Thermoleophilaceae bacterium]
MDDRSYDRFTDADVDRLLAIVRADLDRLHATNPNWQLYRDRLLCVCLCQGGALHFLDGRNGVKDLDLYVFFAAVDERPYPDPALFRAGRHRDFGPSHFGRRAPESRFAHFSGRNVDLFADSLPVPPGRDPEPALREWLTGRRTRQRLLARKAMVMLEPDRGRVVWPTDRSGTPALG